MGHHRWVRPMYHDMLASRGLPRPFELTILTRCADTKLGFSVTHVSQSGFLENLQGFHKIFDSTIVKAAIFQLNSQKVKVNKIKLRVNIYGWLSRLSC